MKRIEQPIFLIGSVRSGSTLTRLMLDHHPRVAFCAESNYLVSEISDDGVYPEIESYRAWLNNNRVFKLSGATVDVALDYEALVNDFLEQKRSRDKKEIVGATIHYEFRKLRRVWPRAKYIYLYRDPRDVAPSVVNMGWAGNAYVGAKWWLDSENEWAALRQTLAPGDWIEVRYEDLITDPRSQLEKVCAFIGVKFDERMFDYAKSTTYPLPDPKHISGWRKSLTRLDVQRLEARLGDKLLSRGYELSGYPRISVSPFTEKYLYLQSRANVLLYKAREYGVALTLKDFLLRRLGLTALHRSVRGQIVQILNSGLRR